MNKLVAALALSAFCATAAPAGAAELFYIPGGNYAEKVHNDQQSDGPAVTLLSHGGLYDVGFSADATIFVNGNGFAQQDGPYTWIKIDPLDVGFTRMGVTLYPDLKFAGLNGNPTVTFDVKVNFLNAASQTLRGALTSNGKIDVWAQGSEVMDSIELLNLSTLTPITVGKGKSAVTTFKDTPLRFEGVKHVSFDPLVDNVVVVPEPATWAMMLMGFFGLGAALRVRSRVAATA